MVDADALGRQCRTGLTEVQVHAGQPQGAVAGGEILEELLQECRLGVGRLTGVAHQLAGSLPGCRTGSRQQGESDHEHALRSLASAPCAGNGTSPAGSVAERREGKIGAQAGRLLTLSGCPVPSLASPASRGRREARPGIVPGVRSAQKLHFDTNYILPTCYTEDLNIFLLLFAGAWLASDPGERRTGCCRPKA